MWEDLLISPGQALTVVASTLGVLFAFVISIRILGQRALARLSAVDLAAGLAAGAILGRASLGHTPTLGAGLVALATLFSAQLIARRLKNLTLLQSLGNAPVLLMAGQNVVTESLKETGVAEEELWLKLRLAGIGSRAEVGLVIMEPNGELSVIKKGAILDYSLFKEVRGIHYLKDGMIHPRRQRVTPRAPQRDA